MRSIFCRADAVWFWPHRRLGGRLLRVGVGDQALGTVELGGARQEGRRATCTMWRVAGEELADMADAALVLHVFTHAREDGRDVLLECRVAERRQQRIGVDPGQPGPHAALVI